MPPDAETAPRRDRPHGAGGQVRREAGSRAPAVEIGWLVAGSMAAETREAAQAASRRMRAYLAVCLPGFAWSVVLVERPQDAAAGAVEPVRLLDLAETVRDARALDFVFVVTEHDLVSHARAAAMATPSTVFSAAVISTAPLRNDPGGCPDLAARVFALAMHLLGRLNNLDPGAGSGFMRSIEAPADLDGIDGFDPEQRAALADRLAAVADLRVEEMEGARPGRLGFYARSIWQNRRSLPGLILRMRPWSFPGRLSRLTTAAGSALVVLMMTAESWEVAAQLSGPAIAGLTVLALAATSAYVTRAQRLLTPRRSALREQRAVSNVASVAAVALGMLATYAAAFALSALLAFTLFGTALLDGWVGVAPAEAAGVRVRMAAVIAALSLAIGALGASFEPYGYFRHVTQIDDEL